MFLKNTSLFYFFLLIFVFTSCTVHRSAMQGSRCNGKCNYQTIAIGISEKKQILGIGGSAINGMLFEAKRNLYRTYPLRKGEFYDNFVVDYKTTYYLFFAKSLVTVTADVVIENASDKEQLFSENYTLALNAGKVTVCDNILISDSVVYLQRGKLKRGIVLDFKGKDAFVLIDNNKGNQIFKEIAAKKLFTIGNEEIEEITGFEAGQVMEITSGGTKQECTKVKKIMGVRTDKLLISLSSKDKTTYSIVSLDKLKSK
jgi:hypothetical protein